MNSDDAASRKGARSRVRTKGFDQFGNAVALLPDNFVRYSTPVNGQQFIRRTRKWARANGRVLSVEKARGKGGHQIARLDNGCWTTVKSGEIGTGLLNAMLDQLEIPKQEF